MIIIIFVESIIFHYSQHYNDNLLNMIIIDHDDKDD